MNSQKQFEPSEMDDGPWYRQPWAWFILTPLIAVVISSSVLLTIALGNADDLIKDDYYKDGLAINESMEKDHLAETLQLTGQLRFDLELAEVVLDLSGQAAIADQVMIVMEHPVSAKMDLTITLNRVAGDRFVGQLNRPLKDRWYVSLEGETAETPAQAWRFVREINFNHQQQLQY